MANGTVPAQRLQSPGRYVDWSRLGRRALIATLLVVATGELLKYAAGIQLGSDFLQGTWRAGHDFVSGRSPYLSPSAPGLGDRHAFFSPPLLAAIAVPFSALPSSVALVLWDVMCLCMFTAALWLLGVRDRRVYLFSVCSFPFVDSLVFGQAEALLVLGVVIAWRYRDSWPGGVAVGVVVALKLLVWPLLLWLLITRRFKSFAVAATSALALLAISWACISFGGLGSYPKLLSADARSAGYLYSPIAEAFHLGATNPLATALAIAFTAIVAISVVVAARGSDEGWYTAAIACGLLSSPLLEIPYLVLPLVPLAILRPQLDRVWLVTAGLWLLPLHETPGVWQVSLVIGTAAVVAISAPLRLPTRPLISS